MKFAHFYKLCCNPTNSCLKGISSHYRTNMPNICCISEDEAFSVIAFVWGPGQVAPVHDHLVWGLVGIYKGAVEEKRYRRVDHGEAAPRRYTLEEVGTVHATKGDISFVYPPDYDIHGVSNPHSEVAVTIHVYGADIGKQERHIHDPQRALCVMWSRSMIMTCRSMPICRKGGVMQS